MSFFKQKKNIVKHWLEWLINAFENSNFIRFISNYYTCSHNILRTLSSKCIKEMCNINIIFDTKTWKTKHWLQFLWLLYLWMYPHTTLNLPIVIKLNKFYTFIIFLYFGQGSMTLQGMCLWFMSKSISFGTIDATILCRIW
jgi:hypothetical protein